MATENSLKSPKRLKNHMDLAESKKIMERIHAESEHILSLEDVKAKHGAPHGKGAKIPKKKGRAKR